jgi:cytochrome c556
MRRFTVWLAAALVALAGAGAIAQSKIATLADHVALMKSNAQANGALNKAVGSGAFADARTQVATLRQNLTTLQAFWMEKKNDDAVKVVKEGLGRLDALDKMLGAATVDQVAAQAAAKEFGGSTCGACHKMLREGDNQTGFRFQAGKSPF